ncbi:MULTISPECIES: PEP/pyruvate-binding domain-containing protein [unclassified Endozoicomonas]|uniref:PEP/pyruvate-binding domain-containing protein n=1 Tax=unclassified Endozoicomonas TaxID=2644528 RepID=UPI003BB7E9C5
MIASDDYYEQVKDSEAARKIRGLHRQVDRLSGSQPVIIRSSGINEDNYGDAQAGKYLSVIQAGGDVFRTCLKVMASGYRPEVCPQGIPQPMALIIQQCIDCRYGGVVMSFQSFQDDTVRIEYTLGQPRGAAVAGQSGNTPHRIDICRREGAENFQYFPGKVSSYFVLHKNNNGYSETFEVRSLRDEILTLSNRFEALKKTIRSGLETIILLLDNGKNRQITFHQWLTACQQLKSSLQALNPKEVEQVRSVHELIFALHRRFVYALAPISQHSGQGELSKEKKITYLDYTTQRNPGEKAPLLRPSSKPLIEKLNCYGTVVIMDDVLIVNLKLGSHVCLIDLLEYAEGGKERTLRLKFSDQFYKDDGVGKTAKLKRMWLLVQLLKVLQLDENADSMKLNCNAVAGGITVECTRMKSTKNMQDAFEKLIIALRDMRNVDCKMQYIKVFEGDQWSFSLLAQRLTGDVAAEADRFAFQHCLFAMYYEQHFTCSPDYLLLLPEHYQQFINYAQRFAECRDKSCRDKSCRDKSCRDKSEDDYRQILISNEITEETRREFLHHLLFLDAKRTAPLVEDVYPDLRDKYYVIKPSSYSYRPSFEIPPDLWLSDDKEIFKKPC